MIALSESLSKTLSISLSEQIKTEVKALENRVEGRMVKNMTKAMSTRDPMAPVHPVDFSSMREAYDVESSEDSADDDDYDAHEQGQHQRHGRGDISQRPRPTYGQGPHLAHARGDNWQGPRPSFSQRPNSRDADFHGTYRAPPPDGTTFHQQSEFPHMTRARSRNHRPSGGRHNDADNSGARKVIDVLKKYEGPKFALNSKQKQYADDWIRAFDNWFRGRVGDPGDPDRQYGESAVRLVMLAVQDHPAASEWCRNRIRQEPKTYQSFMYDFSEAFMSLSESRRRVQPMFLQRRRQRAEEPILRYNIDFKKRVDLHRTACDHARRIPDERLLLSSYAAGLHDKQNSVRAMKRQSLEDAMQYLQNKEAVYREVLLARAPNSKGKDIDSDDDEATSDDGSQDSGSDDDDSNTSKGSATKASKGGSMKTGSPPDSWKEEIKGLSKGVEALSLLLNGQLKNFRARTPSAPRVSGTRDMSKIQCYNCEEYGHYSSKCPKPAKPKTLLVQQYLNSGPEDPESVGEFAAFLAAVEVKQQESSRQQSFEEDF